MELSARSSCRLLLLLVLAAACSTQRSPIEEAGVLRLTDSDYAATLADKPLLVVNYCARWSRSCKLLADEYHATARLLARRGHTGILAELDASEEVRSAQQARIGSYPAIKLFRKGQLVDTFAGDHTADALTSYVEKHLAGKAKPPPPPQRVKQDSAVLTLSERSFDQALSEHDVILVEFYAPWCAHCKRLAPDYERAASTLQKAGTPVALAKIDATMERGPTARFAIQGYPTLLLFQYSEEIDNYTGGRSTSQLVDYMKKHAL